MQSSGRRFTLPLPREHGAWAMFVTPLGVGIGTAGIVNVQVILLGLAEFGFFLLRYPLMIAIKSRARQAREHALLWSAIYAAFTAVFGLVLFAATQLWLLVPLAALGMLSLAVYLWQAAHRAEMSTWGEWTGIAGLALGAPAAFLVATGHLDATAIAIYVLNLLYFGGAIFYIKFKVRDQPRLLKQDGTWFSRLRLGRVTVVYHAFAFVIVALFAFVGLVPALAPIAFVPVLCKAVGGVLTRPAARLNMRRLGFVELGLTITFGLVMLLAYHFQISR